MYYVNPNLVDLNRIFDQHERKSYLRLDLNENPGGLPKNFVKSVLRSITHTDISQYPETLECTKKIAHYINVEKENICLVNGSAEGIRYIIEAFTSDQGKIIGVLPSYFMFQVYAEMYNRVFVPIKYNGDLSINVDDIINEISEDTQLLILLNPNNPIGNVYSDDEIEKLINKAIETKTTVLIDEAYNLFYPKTFLKYAINNDNIFITRTFSKLFSMAGCRLGYVVGSANSIRFIQKLTTPHNTNILALRFAEKVLDSPEIIEKLINKYRVGREYLTKELKKYNYTYHGENGNFIFIKPKTNPVSLVEKMKIEKNILIKSYKDIGYLGTCLRVSIGEKKYMQHFIEALIELDI